MSTPASSAAQAHGYVHRDDVGSRLGMWLFLFTELILFGGMFIAYAVYRSIHPESFKLAAEELDTMVGTVNTVILLTSSLTVAMSITATAKGQKKLSIGLVGVTILLAIAFLVNKYFEWGHKFELGIYPGAPELVNKTQGEILYFGLYYVMTGLHALHVIIGMTILAFVMVFMARGSVNKGSYVKLEVGALYWHLVDVIWIFLFPLFYLLH